MVLLVQIDGPNPGLISNRETPQERRHQIGGKKGARDPDFQALSKVATLLRLGIIRKSQFGIRGTGYLKTKAAYFCSMHRSFRNEDRSDDLSCDGGLSTAAFADTVKTDVKPAAAAAAINNSGASMQMKPATAGNASAIRTCSQTSGSMMSAWKTGGNSDGFAGNSGGCHFDGQGGAEGFKSNGGR